MDLEIAYIKYVRGQLMSSQLPVIATQAMVQGYDSRSLVLLASAREPSLAEHGPLFEAAMRELDIGLPKKSSWSGVEQTGPLSVASAEFLEPVRAALERYGDLLVHQRFAYTAGTGGGWHFVKGMEQLQRLLDSGKSKTAYTVILEPELPIRGTAGSELLEETIRLFNQLGDVRIAVLSPEGVLISCHSVEWQPRGWKAKDAEKGLQDSRDKIYQLFERHRGAQVAVGRDLYIWDEDIVQITGYIPDADGVVRPGAY